MYVIELKNMVTVLYASQEGRHLRIKMYSLGGVRLRKCSGGRFTVPELVCLAGFQVYGSRMCTVTLDSTQCEASKDYAG